MKIKLSFLKFTYFFALFSLLFHVPAYAYIDPATTTYLIQIVAGIFIAAGATIGIFWKKIKLFFRTKKMDRLEKKLTKEAEKKEK
ncbi:MAG: hypothetical protein LUH21_18895 [Clostridiales bacterium]|nr:hypothetical protein [Clostridiales bacterium]